MVDEEKAALATATEHQKTPASFRGARHCISLDGATGSSVGVANLAGATVPDLNMHIGD